MREEIEFRIFLPFSLLALVELDRQEGRLEAARDGATRAREIAVEIRSPSQAVFALVALGDVDATAGDSAAARANYEQALSEAREAALERGVALAASKLADLDKRV